MPLLVQWERRVQAEFVWLKGVMWGKNPSTEVQTAVRQRLERAARVGWESPQPGT